MEPTLLDQITALVPEKHHGTIALVIIALLILGRAWHAIVAQGGILDVLTKRGGLIGIWRAIAYGKTPSDSSPPSNPKP